ncbi:MAG: hypothetical protein AB8G11_09660 [Saprospiraceae bacterium]
MDILEDREELYEFYKCYCLDNLNMPLERISKDFKSVILTRYDFMPYFFVVELQRRGYDLTISEDLFCVNIKSEK